MSEERLDERSQLLRESNFLDTIQRKLEKVNVLDVFRIRHQEVAHSAFWRWLLDPGETHRMGELFLRTFLRYCDGYRPPDKDTIYEPAWPTPTLLDIEGARLDRNLPRQAGSGSLRPPTRHGGPAHGLGQGAARPIDDLMNAPLVIDDLIFELRWSPRRKTVGITVDRGGELIVAAPEGVPVSRVERAVRDKQAWIYGKLALKEDLLFGRVRREFVTGETFHYLGRGYRLKLITVAKTTEVPPLRLVQGRFLLRRDEQARGQEIMIRWYIAHGQPWIERRVGLLAARFDRQPSGVQVRDLGYRWGSCGQAGALNFHWRVARLPPRIVEYVVAHELVHLGHPHHTPAFWRSLESAMPDYAARRTWLAENGVRF